MIARTLIRNHRLTRGFATHAGPNTALPAVLHLKTGQSFHGRSFGAPKSTFGETVFSTSITSCQSSLFRSDQTPLTYIIRHRVHDRPLLSEPDPCLHHPSHRKLWGSQKQDSHQLARCRCRHGIRGNSMQCRRSCRRCREIFSSCCSRIPRFLVPPL